MSGSFGFVPLIDQRARLLQLDCALPALALIPERLVLNEALDRPFESVLDCISTDASLDLDALIGEQLTVRLRRPDASYRPFHGYVFEAAQLGSDGGWARYRLTMGPWSGFMAHRRDAFLWQGRNAREIVEDVFGDHPQANFRFELSEPLRARAVCTQYRESDLAFVSRLLAEEGLTTRVDHLDGTEAGQADEHRQARHVLVITDRTATLPALGPMRYTRADDVARLPGQRDAITAFASARSLEPNAVALGSWDPRMLTGSGAVDAGVSTANAMPSLEIYDGSGAGYHASIAHAERAASLAMQALELASNRFEGRGSARHFAAGHSFTLVGHPVHGAGSDAAAAASDAAPGRSSSDESFVLLAVEHHAVNDLGSEVAKRLRRPELEGGGYRNRFRCAPARQPLVPRFVRKPTAPGAQTAIVVGLEGEAASTDRDHRVQLQFPWQRGRRALAGGLPAGAGDAGDAANAGAGAGGVVDGTASGHWVRVALPSAGANWGSVLVPRIGTEVLVGFVEGDIDRPTILGSLYNGEDRPPFAAGIDAGVDHPGVISGLHTRSLDGSGYNQWVLDDATGQLRMRLSTSQSRSTFAIGHLIAQPARSASRGAWRGSGFEAVTAGWGSLRAGCGLLLSTHATAETPDADPGTQLQAPQTVAQLRAAAGLGQRLAAAAAAGRPAGGLRSFATDQAVGRLTDGIDPSRRGRHPDRVDGQAARRAGPDGRTPGADPVEAFAEPYVLLETPSAAVFTTEATLAAYAGTDLSVAVGGDLHQAAGSTCSAIAGGAASLYAHRGGIGIESAHGPIELEAHADGLEILADRDIVVTSVDDVITVEAPDRLELVAGESSIVIDGPDIRFMTPGRFEAKFSQHRFLAPGGEAAELPKLPTGSVTSKPGVLHLEHRYHDDEPASGAAYEVRLPDGSRRTGRLDALGRATLTGIDAATATVSYGPAAGAYARKDTSPTPNHDANPSADRLAGLVDRYLGALDAAPPRATGPAAATAVTAAER